MAATTESRVYDELVDFIAGGTTPEAIAQFQPSAATRDRVAELVDREKRAGITPAEARELDHFMTLEHLMRLAKAKARRKAAP